MDKDKALSHFFRLVYLESFQRVVRHRRTDWVAAKIQAFFSNCRQPEGIEKELMA